MNVIYALFSLQFPMQIFLGELNCFMYEYVYSENNAVISLELKKVATAALFDSKEKRLLNISLHITNPTSNPHHISLFSPTDYNSSLRRVLSITEFYLIKFMSFKTPFLFSPGDSFSIFVTALVQLVYLGNNKKFYVL
ncbi:hypothetical protein Anas_12560 [Armadillidium nasatum]|uniref:Uncharacterized protein n=1 Tax=Armadillidium nasatum TaxID=96803 RepID=A0A5N5T0U0_9CRUS|nr:hypothetical protein Anas_12560 [Armadillidium nasatum]